MSANFLTSKTPDTARIKDVPGYDGRYQVTDDGRIISTLGRRKFLKPSDNGIGYGLVTFCRNAIKRYYTVHRLVAEAFVPNPDPDRLIEVNHKDHVKANNHYTNLEWVTHAENQSKFRQRYNQGQESEQSILKIPQVKSIRKQHNSLIKQLAEEYGVSVPTIKAIVSDTRWKHVP